MSPKPVWVLMSVVAISAAGCTLRKTNPVFEADLSHYRGLARATAFPDSQAIVTDFQSDVSSPRTIRDPRDPSDPKEWWDMRLEDALQIAVTRSPVLRDLGGTVVRSPASIRTIHGPAIDASEPRAGMEGALSAFDAQVTTSVFVEKNDRMLNNFFTAGGARIFQQDLGVWQSQVSKQAAAGTQMFLRNTVTYDANNAAGNQFPYSWDTILEAEVRQPLLQGAGVEFNRIAGPNAVPGINAGIIVARLNTEVGLVDFRIALRDLVSNVENAYWDLYFAYRDLAAKIEARDGSLEAWRAVQGLVLAQQPGGVAEREAQFREQYYRFEEDVHEALTGRILDRTSTFNGSSGGTFRGVGGVQVAERRLRLVLGLEVNSDRLIRPADEPTMAPISYDWNSVVAEGITRREEICRQRLHVRRREMELIASRNFLLPRLDLVSRYRWRGLGENLLNSPQDAFDPAFSDFGNSSLGNLFGGHYQEWQLGGELIFPVGFRRAHAAVRNAQLQLARERAIMQEQERQVLHDLSNAVADVYRAYDFCQTNYNCRLAAKKQVDILQEKLRGRLPVNLDQLIDAERRFADRDVQYQRSLAEYMIAIKNVHFEKGSLLEYCQVHLTEGPEVVTGDSVLVSKGRAARSPELLNYVLRKSWFGGQTGLPEATSTGTSQSSEDNLPE